MTKHLGNILEPMPLMDRARRGRAALVHAGRRLAVVGAAGRARGARGDRPQGAADLLEHRGSFQSLYARDRRLDARRRRPGARATGRCSTGGCCPSSHRLVARGRRGAGGLRHRSAPARRLAELHRRPVQLVRPAVPAAVLGRRPGGAGDPARVPGTLTRLLAPLVPVHHRAGLAGRCCAR